MKYEIRISGAASDRPRMQVVAENNGAKSVKWDSSAFAAKEEVPSKPSDIGAAPATNIAKSALASEVQASLGKADAALSRAEAEAGFTEWTVTPPTYDGSKLTVYWNEAEHFWELHNESGINVATPIPEQSGDETELYWDDGEPFSATRTRLPTMADVDAVKGNIPYDLVNKNISNNAVTLDDRTSNIVTILATLSPNTLTVNFPTVPTGKARDFALLFNIEDGVTAPELAWQRGVTLKNDGGEMPEIVDGESSTILYFSEVSPDVFLVKGETLTAIARPQT